MDTFLIDKKLEQPFDSTPKPNIIYLNNGVISPPFNQDDITNTYIPVNTNDENYLLNIGYIKEKQPIIPSLTTLFVACGESTGLVIYSTDGINWSTPIDLSPTSLSSNMTSFKRGVYSTLDNNWYFGGIGNNPLPSGGKILFSLDPTNISSYSGVSLSSLSFQITDIAYSPSGRYVASNSSATGTYADNPQIVGGLGWVAGGTIPGAFATTGVSFGNGIYVSSCFRPFPGGNSIITSSDGINWTGRGDPHGSNISSKTVYSSTLNRWVSVGTANNSSQNAIAYSNDNGVTWTGITSNSIFTSGQFIIFEKGLFVAVGNGNFQIAYSSDGINWTGVPGVFFTGTGLTIGRSVTYSKNIDLFVAVGTGTNSTNTIATSKDGINWIPLGSNPFGVGVLGGISIACSG